MIVEKYFIVKIIEKSALQGLYQNTPFHNSNKIHLEVDFMPTPTTEIQFLLNSDLGICNNPNSRACFYSKSDALLAINKNNSFGYGNDNFAIFPMLVRIYDIKEIRKYKLLNILK